MKNKLRILRKQAGLKLKHLAEKLDTTAQTISRLETGQMTLSTDWIERIATVLNVDPLDIFQQKSDLEFYAKCNNYGAIEPFKGFVSTKQTAKEPLVVMVTEAYGIWRKGEILIADKAMSIPENKAFYALVMYNSGELHLGTVLKTKTMLDFTPFPILADKKLDTRDNNIFWIAPIISSFINY
jgi:transcriptional regulator with XRE-family HTH domain